MLKKTGGIPLYIQIRKFIREDIANQVLAPGQKLPSEDELAIRFGVSRMTVRQGITDLIEEGILYRRHGVGTFVSQPYLDRDHTRLTSFLESARAEGLEVKIEVLLTEIVPAKLKVAHALNMTEGEQAIRIKTLRIVSQLPITVHDAYVPYKLMPNLLSQDLATQHLWDVFETLGFRVKRAVQRLEAREADEEIAAFLQMAEGLPILYTERTVYLDDGTPVEFTYCYNRGDRYRLTVVLDR